MICKNIEIMRKFKSKTISYYPQSCNISIIGVTKPNQAYFQNMYCVLIFRKKLIK